MALLKQQDDMGRAESRRAGNGVTGVRLYSSILLLGALAGCGSNDAERPVRIDIVGRSADLVKPQANDRALAAQTVMAATGQGLVTFDAKGDVVAGLAESWIVADGGQSYIFRLRRTNWPNGQGIKADQVAQLLTLRMRASPDLLAGLKPEVRAMTERVIEIRLQTALPAFIQILAQPRLAILSRAGGTGSFEGRFERKRLRLKPRKDVSAESDKVDDEEIVARDRRVIAADRAAIAIARYRLGQSDLVLGGMFQDLLLLPPARLSATDVHADPSIGLLGLVMTGRSALLDDRNVRYALSRVINRAQLAQDLNLLGWTATSTPLPGQLDMAGPPTPVQWATSPLERERAIGQVAIDQWKSRHGSLPMLTVALPAGAGATLLFRRLASDLGQIGIRLDRVGPQEQADLRLIDEVAAFDSALWFLARLDCAAGVRCDPAASAALDRARTAANRGEQAAALSEAERLIVEHGAYIPLGLPIRWSLVGRRLTGFSQSPRALHPLDRLFRTRR